MPRSPREEDHGALHHVVVQGNNRCRIVRDDRDRAVLLRGFAHTTASSGWRCHAYCLLDTHLHALVETALPNLGRGIGMLLGRYSRSHNVRYRREGHLFMRPFYSRRIRGDEHLLTAAIYVVMNPVRAGLCGHPSEWAWSSYAATAEGTESFVASELILGLVGGGGAEARARYRALVDEHVARAAVERELERQARR